MNRFAEILNERGLRQREVAVKAGTDPSTINDCARWGKVPGPNLRRRIADALELPEEAVWPAKGGDEP